MIRQVRHPLVGNDLIALVDHIVESTDGDTQAAARRLDQVEALLSDIASNPQSGLRLAPPLDGWLVRHGGDGHRITIVFRSDPQENLLYVALVAFGGQDWMSEGTARREFGGQ